MNCWIWSEDHGWVVTKKIMAQCFEGWWDVTFWLVPSQGG